MVGRVGLGACPGFKGKQGRKVAAAGVPWDFLRVWAARVEGAAGRRVDGGGDVTGEDDALAFGLAGGVREGYGREQGAGVGVGGV